MNIDLIAEAILQAALDLQAKQIMKIIVKKAQYETLIPLSP